MGADVSRVRFDPLRDHSGVLLQQGRLLLDADWNEQADVIGRRLRASAVDLGTHGPVDGIAGIAAYPATTPDAFQITFDGDAMQIGRGRMYVDGLLAENHGTGSADFDPVLAEPRHADRMPYLEQPYWPTPKPLPSATTRLVYLDVWDREVTYLEATDLVEPGVAVDTTTRTQTVWQIRVHEVDTPDIDCATADADISGWLDVITPSGGRLTTGTIAVPDTEDPCSLPPTGGYRGLENQTYRVEIHTGGPGGTATFKWATDNASVASPVIEVLNPTTLRPASLGRDDVLSFRTGDWVEVLDDHYELDQRPGAMFKITVDPDAEAVTLNAPLPGDLQLNASQAADQHLRIRRWSQRGQVKDASGGNLDDLDRDGSPGVITVPAFGVAVVLIQGVTVALDSVTESGFRPGDHWIFTARTNSTSVEELTQAPPRGVHHHYARLSVVTLPAPPEPGGDIGIFAATDCRRPWPPSGGGCGDCTVCVTPESHADGTFTIQAAIDEVTPTGGTVCLAAGRYMVPEGGIYLTQANGVTVHGQGPRTMLTAQSTAIEVRTCVSVLLENFAVYSEGGPIIALVDTADTTVRRLDITLAESTDLADGPQAAIGLDGVAVRTSLRDNMILASRGIAAGDTLLTADLDISGNAFRGRGIVLDGTVAHVLANTVHHNSFYHSFASTVRLVGQVGPGGSVTVADNTVFVNDEGIQVGTAGFDVHDNTVIGTAGGGDGNPGIAVVPGFGDQRGRIRIAGNTVRGFNGPGVAVRAPVTECLISDNLIERSTHGIVMDERSRAATISVAHNVLRDLERREGGAVGIQVAAAELVAVESNIIRGLDQDSETTTDTTGILIVGTRDVRAAHNTIEEVGPDGQTSGPLRGIHIGGMFQRVTVTSNSARRLSSEFNSDAPQVDWTGLLIGQLDQDPPVITRFRDYVFVARQVGYLLGHRTVMAAFFSPGDTMAVVEGNTIAGAGKVPTALVALRGDVAVTGNQFRQVGGTPALQVLAASATVTGNRARGGTPSIALQVNAQRIAVLGNLTSNGIVVNGAALGAPWALLNPNGV